MGTRMHCFVLFSRVYRSVPGHPADNEIIQTPGTTTVIDMDWCFEPLSSGNKIGETRRCGNRVQVFKSLKYSLMQCQVCWQSPEWLLMRLFFIIAFTEAVILLAFCFPSSPLVSVTAVCVRTMSCLALRRKWDGVKAVYACCRSSLFVSWCFEPSQPKRITLITFDADLLRMTFILGPN